MKNKTLYAVSRGEYSNYQVIAIFDDKTLAEKFRDSVSNPNEIEEYELNPYKTQLRKGFKCFRVVMQKDGSSETELEYFTDDDNRFDVIQYRGEPEKQLRARVWARDEQHAVKIVNEKRTRLIAGNDWTVGEKK